MRKIIADTLLLVGFSAFAWGLWVVGGLEWCAVIGGPGIMVAGVMLNEANAGR